MVILSQDNRSKLIKFLDDLWWNISWYSFHKPYEFVKGKWRGYVTTRHHVIKTELPVQSWWEVDTRILYGMMALLKEFVEKQQPFRSDEITYFNKNIGNDKIVTNPQFNVFSKKMESLNKDGFCEIEWTSDEFHVTARQEMLIIYLWWMDYKRRQKEISDALTTWDNGITDCGKKNFLDALNAERTPEEISLMDRLHELEDKLHSEEEDMLIRIIKIRDSLWT